MKRQKIMLLNSQRRSAAGYETIRNFTRGKTSFGEIIACTVSPGSATGLEVSQKVNDWSIVLLYLSNINVDVRLDFDLEVSVA